MAAGSGSDRAVNSGTKPPVGIAITQSSSLLRRMWTVAEPLFQQAAREVAVPVGAAEATSAREPQQLERLTAGWALPAPPAGPAVGEIGAETDEEKPVSFYWVGNTLRHIGIGQCGINLRKGLMNGSRQSSNVAIRTPWISPMKMQFLTPWI